MSKKLSKLQTEDLCVSSLSWVDEMAKELAKNMEDRIAMLAIKYMYGDPVVEYLKNIKSMTFTAAYALCSKTEEEIFALDDSRDTYKGITFHALEDVLFNVGEIARAYRRIQEIIALVGDTDEVEIWADVIAANVIEFAVE